MSRLFENELCERAIIKIANGDLSALNVLYDRFGKLLFSVAYSLLNDRHAAEDVLHDTFIKVVDNASLYREQKRNGAKAWLVTVCRNLALDKIKHQKYENNLNTSSYTVSETEQIDSDMAFMSMLSELNPEERQIVILKVAWGLKHTQIAAVLNITPENARQKYTRAINRLNVHNKEVE